MWEHAELHLALPEDVVRTLVAALGVLLAACLPVRAQTPPTGAEIAAYTGLHAAVVGGSTAEIERLVRGGADINARDAFGRTPLMVAAYRHDVPVARALLELGANVNALDHQSVDVLTIAVAHEGLELLQLAIVSGGNVRAITGPFGGTALSAAARLGNARAVQTLIAARAPVDHVNYLGATALLEAIAHGDGGPRTLATVKALVEAGADVNHGDHDGAKPLALARARGFADIASLLERAGGAP